MTDNELRVAIAEACGWVRGAYTADCYKGEGWLTPGKTEKDALEQGNLVAWRVGELPDYLNDLNAMHEAEKAIPRHLWTEYTMELRKVIQRECDTEEHYVLGCERSQLIADFWFYHATARQRALAFVATMQKP